MTSEHVPALWPSRRTLVEDRGLIKRRRGDVSKNLTSEAQALQIGRARDVFDDDGKKLWRQ